MDYLDCKGLSEAAETSTNALGALFLVGCRLEGVNFVPAFYELQRRRSVQLQAFERASAIYLASLPVHSWSRPAAARSRTSALAGAAH